MFDVLLGAPVIVKVLGALALILVLNRFVHQLVVSIGVGALVLAFWSGHSVGETASIAAGRLGEMDTILLLVVICQVIVLSSQMAETGVMQDLLTTVRSLVSRRTAMALLPAMIGLLPMPGGALFSAPLVESCDPEGVVPDRLKAQTNHWFRHVWEYWWPLYPGVLLAMQLTDLDLWQIMLYGLPLTLCATVAGRIFLLSRIEPGTSEESEHTNSRLVRRLIWLMLPIIVVIASYGLVRGGYALLNYARPDTRDMNRYLPMLLGLFAAMAVLQFERPLSPTRWSRLILSRRALNMAAIVAMVRVYGAFIECQLPGGETVIGQMRAEMDAWGVPVIAIVMLLPFIGGLATGITLGFVGATFPIVMELAGADPDTATRLSTAALAFGFGYVGQLLSPVHVCLVVTSEHFKTEVLHNTIGLLKPSAVILAGALVLYFLLG
jgi:hypothetical protein